MTSPAPAIPVPGLSPGWEQGAPATPEPPAPPQTAGEKVLARLMALGDEPGATEEYRRALGDVLHVLSDCADSCHREGHR